jgi:hypothetical protein
MIPSQLHDLTGEVLILAMLCAIEMHFIWKREGASRNYYRWFLYFFLFGLSLMIMGFAGSNSN